MATWKKVTFISVLIAFIGLSVFFSFYAISRDTYEFKNLTDENGAYDGWVFYGFNGNTDTKTVNIDYVRDKKGENPDTAKPVVAVSDFTIVSDEYVEYINIGKDVKHIDESAFYYCKKLKAVFVDKENEYFTSVDGVLYSKDMKTLILRPILNGDYLVSQSGEKDEEKAAEIKNTFVIPDTVERINSYSFYKNVDLVHLTIPESIKEIGDMAFFGCNSLWSIWLPEGLISIGNDAFSYCWSMSPIMYIPATVTDIGHHAFFSCSGISVIYMGAADDSSIKLGEDWRPKSIKSGVIQKAPEPEYGKTLSGALAEKERLDNAAKEDAK